MTKAPVNMLPPLNPQAQSVTTVKKVVRLLCINANSFSGVICVYMYSTLIPEANVDRKDS